MADHWKSALQKLPTEDVPLCLLCGTADGIPDSRWALLLAIPSPYRVARCPHCGLRWLSTRPTEVGYRALYSNEMYFGGRGSSPAEYKHLVPARIAYLSKRLARACSLLGELRPLKVLDYGAATGDFVAAARGMGHICDGIEISDDARRDAMDRLGIELLPPEAASNLPPAQYDIIHMNHVLEHMPNPLTHFNWCFNMLRPGGLILVEVPQQFDNDLDRVRRMLRIGGMQKGFDAYSLHHTCFFTPRSLLVLLEKTGFAPVVLRTFNPEKAPLWPPSVKNWIINFWLRTSDSIHRGGNIIETIATRLQCIPSKVSPTKNQQPF